MKIENVIQNINLPANKGQADQSSNSRTSGSKTSSLTNLNIHLSARDNKQEEVKPAGNGLLDLKAIFALDKDKNVVIQFLDEKGEIVKQVPPEEYINMVKKLETIVENLFSKVV